MTAQHPAVVRSLRQPRGASTIRQAGSHRFCVVGPPLVVEAVDEVFGTLPAVTTAGGATATPVHNYVIESVGGGLTVLGAGPTDSAPDVAGCLDIIQWHVNQQVIDGIGDRETGIHAACAMRAGHVILLPGESGAGKSTTVAGLARRGWAYVTDETAVISDSTLHVTPYHKPIALDRGAWPLFPDETTLRSEDSCLVPAPRLGAALGPGGRLTAVVAPTYQPRASARVEALSPAALVMLLAQCTFSFSAAGARHLRTLAVIAREIPGYRLVVGDLEQAVATIDGLMGDMR